MMCRFSRLTCRAISTNRNKEVVRVCDRGAVQTDVKWYMSLVGQRVDSWGKQETTTIGDSIKKQCIGSSENQIKQRNEGKTVMTEL